MAAVGEDSSRQDIKKNMRWESFTPRDQLMEVTGRDLSLGSAGRDQVLQLTVSGA